MPVALGRVFQHRVTPSLLTLLYVERQQDAPMIARYLECSKQTVYHYLRKYGIPRRTRQWHVTGVRSPLFGQHHTEETKRRIASSLKGRVPVVNQRPMSDAHREAIRQAAIRMKGVHLPHRSGPEHWNWQGGIAYVHDRGRHKRQLIPWRLAVFTRDAYTCQACHRVGGRLNAHHIRSWSKYPDQRFDAMNGVTLCVSCHALAHGFLRRTP